MARVKFKSAEEPLMGSTPYHVRVSPDKAEKYALLPGDPDRVNKISSLWDEVEVLDEHRQFRAHRGKYKGVGVLAVSTGIGGPATAIVVEELARVGVTTFIRVGSTGAIQPEIKLGDLIISTGAVRMEGTSYQYVHGGYPAVANYEVVMALIEAAESLGLRYHVGITASTDSFYTGQGRKGYKGYYQSWMESLVEDLRSAKVLNFEMEAATLFTLANLFGLRAGCVCAVYAQRVTNEFDIRGEEDAIKVANEAVKVLNEWDHLKKERGRRFLYPSLTCGDNKKKLSMDTVSK